MDMVCMLKAFIAGYKSGAKAHGWVDSIVITHNSDKVIRVDITFEENGRPKDEEDAMAYGFADDIANFFGGMVDVFTRAPRNHEEGYRNLIIKKEC